jgi:hypothetical protein
MIKSKYKLSEEEISKYKEEISKLLSKEISPALVQNKCFKYGKEEIEELLHDLLG